MGIPKVNALDLHLIFLPHFKTIYRNLFLRCLLIKEFRDYRHAFIQAVHRRDDICVFARGSFLLHADVVAHLHCRGLLVGCIVPLQQDACTLLDSAYITWSFRCFVPYITVYFRIIILITNIRYAIPIAVHRMRRNIKCPTFRIDRLYFSRFVTLHIDDCAAFVCRRYQYVRTTVVIHLLYPACLYLHRHKIRSIIAVLVLLIAPINSNSLAVLLQDNIHITIAIQIFRT